MIVTILYRQEGSPYASGSGFRDVPSNQYYSAAVAWASENGIVNGYIDGSFRPNDAVSMQEMLTILLSLCSEKEYEDRRLHKSQFLPRRQSGRQLRTDCISVGFG